MKKAILIFIIFYFHSGFGQHKTKDSIYAKQVNVLNTNFRDFVIMDKLIYALTNGDSLVVIDPIADKMMFLENNIVEISKNRRNHLVTTNRAGDVFEKSESKPPVYVKHIKNKVYELFFDTEDTLLVITNKGVFYKDKLYYPKDGYWPGRKYPSRNTAPFFPKPTLSFLDLDSRLWLTYDKGEFGAEIRFFDLKSGMFYKDEYLYLKSNHLKDDGKKLIDSFPDKIKEFGKTAIYEFPAQLPITDGVKGIVQDENGNYYFSQSLMHFYVSGDITKLEKTPFKDFYNPVYLEGILEYDTIYGKKRASTYLKEYVGPLSLNPFNKSVYYYSNLGFFKINENEKRGNSKMFIFRPWITWKAGLENSVGYQMNISKFEFIDEKGLIFLTSSSGIGYFNGEEVKYFQ